MDREPISSIDINFVVSASSRELDIPEWCPPLAGCDFYGVYSAHLSEGVPKAKLEGIVDYYKTKLNEPTAIYTATGGLDNDINFGEMFAITYLGPYPLGIQTILEMLKNSDGRTYLHKQFAASKR